MEDLTAKEKRLVNQNLAKEFIERLGKDTKPEYIEIFVNQIEAFEKEVDRLEGKLV